MSWAINKSDDGSELLVTEELFVLVWAKAQSIFDMKSILWSNHLVYATYHLVEYMKNGF